MRGYIVSRRRRGQNAARSLNLFVRQRVSAQNAPRFLIQSTRPGGGLEFRWTRPSFMEVVVEDRGLRAVSEIHAIVSGPANLPTSFFDDLAHSWRGWRGAKSWASYEKDLELDATTDGKGHVFLRVKLAAGASQDQWRAQVELALEAGQLAAYSEQFRVFASADQRAA
jgi:uncharacterized protein DUF6228